MDASQLTSRQQMLLGLVVREYVYSVSPVGSRTLVEKYGLDVSPATVRNDLARMEELGYLTHPHTSAGRVPTDQGYRYFVERLLQEKELPLAEKRTIAHQFQQVRRHVGEWAPLAASVLVRTTRSAALVTTPRASKARYRYLQLISTQGRMVLLVLVMQGGLVKQQMLTLPESMSQAELSQVADRLNQICDGLVSQQIQERIADLPSFASNVGQLVVGMMEQADALTVDQVYHDGLRELLQKPEFIEGGHATGVLRMLEEGSLLDTVLVDALDPAVGSVRVMIGEEARFEELRACSLVISRYGADGVATGALGVLGPTRMVYGRAISAVRFVAGMLSDLVYDVFSEGEEPLLPAVRRIEDGQDRES
ncbi:MAG: heat-inducible transcriptional repressor HrcA [Anaerolineae bacterium]|jgi:heat-inducible transcriptional repressor